VGRLLYKGNKGLFTIVVGPTRVGTGFDIYSGACWRATFRAPHRHNTGNQGGRGVRTTWLGGRQRPFTPGKLALQNRGRRRDGSVIMTSVLHGCARADLPQKRAAARFDAAQGSPGWQKTWHGEGSAHCGSIRRNKASPPSRTMLTKRFRIFSGLDRLPRQARQILWFAVAVQET